MKMVLHLRRFIVLILILEVVRGFQMLRPIWNPHPLLDPGPPPGHGMYLPVPQHPPGHLFPLLPPKPPHPLIQHYPGFGGHNAHPMLIAGGNSNSMQGMVDHHGNYGWGWGTSLNKPTTTTTEGFTTTEATTNTESTATPGAPTTTATSTSTESPVTTTSACEKKPSVIYTRQTTVNGECMRMEVDCNDNNLCTDDTCMPDLRCVHTPVNCDDGDPSTEDVCDPATGGCTYTGSC